MQISFAGTQLQGSPRFPDPQEYRLVTTRQAQAVEGIRAVQRQELDRLNAGTELSFSLTREHPTIVDAENFVNTHELNLPNNGLLTLTSYDGQSKQTTTYIQNAELLSVSITYTGTLTFTNYRFAGGRATPTKPT